MLSHIHVLIELLFFLVSCLKDRFSLDLYFVVCLIYLKFQASDAQFLPHPTLLHSGGRVDDAQSHRFPSPVPSGGHAVDNNKDIDTQSQSASPPRFC